MFLSAGIMKILQKILPRKKIGANFVEIWALQVACSLKVICKPCLYKLSVHCEQPSQELAHEGLPEVGTCFSFRYIEADG